MDQDIQFDEKYVEKSLDDLIERIIDEQGDSLIDPTNVLVGVVQQKNALKAKLQEELRFQPLRDQLSRGMSIINEQLPFLFKGEELEKIQNKLQGMKESAKKNLLQEEHEILESFQEILGVSEATITCFYRIGYHLYEQKEFVKSVDVFFVLVTLTPNVYDYWFAFGSANVAIENWDQALRAFSMAMLMNPEVAAPRLWVTQCFIILGDFANAKIELDLVTEMITKSPEQNPQDLSYVKVLSSQLALK